MPAIRVDPSLDLYYEDDYFGPPWQQPETVLLVHGVAESSAAWFAWVPALSSRFRVLRVDQRGFGRSTIPSGSHRWSLPGFAADLAHFLDAMQIHAVHVVAAKLGGTIAMRFAADFPERVLTLSVVSSPVRRVEASAQPKSNTESDRMAAIGIRAWAESTQRARLGSLAPEEQIAFWNDLMASSNREVCINVAKMSQRIDLAESLPKITAPTLMITVADSAKLPPATVLESVRLIQKYEVLTLPGDGYHPAASRPDQCAHEVVQFIARCAGASTA